MVRIGVAVPPKVRRQLLIAVAIVFFAGIYIGKISSRMPDFEVYQRAGDRAWTAEQLYRADDGHYQFKCLPASRSRWCQSVCSRSRLLATWCVCSVALLAGLLTLSLRLLPERRRTDALLVGATIVLLAKFYGHELELGQVNILMAFLIVAAARLMQTGRESGCRSADRRCSRRQAVCRAVPAVPDSASQDVIDRHGRRRPRRGLPGPGHSLQARRERRAAEGVVADGHRNDGAEPDGPQQRLGGIGLHAIAGAFGRPAELLAAASVLALLLSARFVFARRSNLAFPEGLEIGLLLTIMPIVSPQGWDYVFLISTPAVMYLVNYADGLPRSMRIGVTIALLVIAFSIFDLIGRRLTRPSCPGR